jgi:hypothetical protein
VGWVGEEAETLDPTGMGSGGRGGAARPAAAPARLGRPRIRVGT